MLYTASLILVAPPAALPRGANRLNLHSHQRINSTKHKLSRATDTGLHPGWPRWRHRIISQIAQ